MKYEEALKEWGYRRLTSKYRSEIDKDTVTVSFGFDEGFPCCGGSDPHCYCSYFESPFNYVFITAQAPGRKAGSRVSLIDKHVEFDEVIRELFEIGQG